MRSTKLATAIVLTLAMTGTFGCSEDTGGGGGSGGSGGSSGSGGSTGGRGGSGGSSSTGGTTGGSSSTGGTTGGSSSTGGTGGSTGGTGGSTGGTGGSTGGTGGSTGGSGGSTGGTGGTGGSTGGSGGSSADGGKMDRMGDGSGGMEMGGNTGAFILNVTGVDTRMGRRFFVRGQTNGTGNMSPGFEWGPHPEAKSYVLSMVDMSNGGTHWLMYDIPATVTKLPPALMRPNTLMVPEVPGAKHTRFNGNSPFGYFGPGAPSCNRYHFIIHAMKTETLMASGDKNAIRTAAFSMANRIAATPSIEVIGNNSAGTCN